MKTLRHILLADDDMDDCMLFKDVLKDLDLHPIVTVVENGEVLMEYLQKAEVLPDVLMLDINMPKKDGLSCLKAIKGDDRLKALPVIIFSTSADPVLLELTHKEGASLFAKKQHGYTKMMKLINRLLSVDKRTLSETRSLYDFELT